MLIVLAIFCIVLIIAGVIIINNFYGDCAEVGG